MKKIFFLVLLLSMIFAVTTELQAKNKNEKPVKVIQPEMIQVQGGSFNMGSNDYSAQE